MKEDDDTNWDELLRARLTLIPLLLNERWKSNYTLLNPRTQTIDNYSNLPNHSKPLIPRILCPKVSKGGYTLTPYQMYGMIM